LAFGISEKEVAVMLQKNPAKLLYLDEKVARAEDPWLPLGRESPAAQA